jgi:hypothetical protein
MADDLPPGILQAELKAAIVVGTPLKTSGIPYSSFEFSKSFADSVGVAEGNAFQQGVPFLAFNDKAVRFFSIFE